MQDCTEYEAKQLVEAVLQQAVAIQSLIVGLEKVNIKPVIAIDHTFTTDRWSLG